MTVVDNFPFTVSTSAGENNQTDSPLPISENSLFTHTPLTKKSQIMICEMKHFIIYSGVRFVVAQSVSQYRGFFVKTLIIRKRDIRSGGSLYRNIRDERKFNEPYPSLVISGSRHFNLELSTSYTLFPCASCSLDPTDNLVVMGSKSLCIYV